MNDVYFLIQEEIFLSQLLTSMHISPETVRGKGGDLGNLRNFISQFTEVPQIFKRGRMGFIRFRSDVKGT